MADIVATRRVLQAATALIASARAHLERLSIKLSKAQETLQQANIAYRDSLRFITPAPDPFDEG